MNNQELREKIKKIIEKLAWSHCMLCNRPQANTADKELIIKATDQLLALIEPKMSEDSMEKRLEALEDLHEDVGNWMHEDKPHSDKISKPQINIGLRIPDGQPQEFCECRTIEGKPNKTYIDSKSKTCLYCDKPLKPTKQIKELITPYIAHDRWAKDVEAKINELITAFNQHTA